MKFKETLLGLVVLALVLGGVYWVRRPHPAPMAQGAAAPHAGTMPALGAGHDAASHQPQGTTDDSSVPDVTTDEASIDVEGVRVTLSVSPRPPVAFEKTHVRVRVTPGSTSASARAAADQSTGVAPVLTDGVIWFEMKMPMGDHRYTLIAGTDGWQEATVVLPFCPSGNPRWYANVEGTVAGTPVRARFRLDLTTSKAAP